MRKVDWKQNIWLRRGMALGRLLRRAGELLVSRHERRTVSSRKDGINPAP